MLMRFNIKDFGIHGECCKVNVNFNTPRCYSLL